MSSNKHKHRWLGWTAAFGYSHAVGPASAAALEPPTPSAEVRFEAAMIEMERCHWPAAFERLAELADSGHGQAARIALLMQAHGTRLFGGSFRAEPARRRQWLDAAAPRSQMAE